MFPELSKFRAQELSGRSFRGKVSEVTNTESSFALTQTRRAKPREPRFELFGGSRILKMEKWVRGCLPQGSPRT